jgi:uncharacterized protein (TIGR02145 family)
MVDATSMHAAKIGVNTDKELTFIAIFAAIGFISGIVLGGKAGFGLDQCIFTALWIGIGVGGALGYSIASLPIMFVGLRIMSYSAGRALKYVFCFGLFYLVIGLFAGFFFPLILVLIRLSRRKKCVKIVVGEEHAIVAIEHYYESETQDYAGELRRIANHIVLNFILVRDGSDIIKVLKKLKTFDISKYFNNTKIDRSSGGHYNDARNDSTNKHAYPQSVEKHNDNVNTNRSTEQIGTPPDPKHTMLVSRGSANKRTQRRDDENDCFTDNRDGQKYRTVKIGGQVWMTENLNYKIDNSWCYDNNESDYKKYGRLYTWDAAMAACPTGWRLPSADEWNKLITTVGGPSAAGRFLKAVNGWNHHGDGVDHYGFSALPGGYRVAGGKFGGAGDYGNWWTASKFDNDNAYVRSIQCKSDNVGESRFNMSCGFSVRCVQTSNELKNINNAAEYVDRGNAYKENGEFDKAIEDYTEAIRLDPGYSMAYCLRGNAYGAKGYLCDNTYDAKDYYDKAIADCNEAIRLDPANVAAYGHRGNVYGIMGDYKKALADQTKAIKIDPANSTSYFYRGNVYGNKGDHNKAIADYTKAIRLAPDKDAAYYFYRASVYGSKGAYKKAIADYTNTIRLNPNQESAYFYRAITHAQLGRARETVRDLEKALELAPDSEYATYVQLAIGDIKAGKKARAVIDRLLQMCGVVP